MATKHETTYFNATAGSITIAGVEYLPGASVPIPASRADDPVIDWLKRMEYLREGRGGIVGGVNPVFIPTLAEKAEGKTIRMTDAPVPETVAPVAPTEIVEPEEGDPPGKAVAYE